MNFTRKTNMKTLILISAIAAVGLLGGCATSATVVSAQEQTAPAKPAMSMDMEKHMSQMQEKMKAMQAKMDTIHNTPDPKERQKLMQQHMQAMQENMKTMHGMGGSMMSGGGQPGGMMMGGMKDGDMTKHHAMMGKHMDMMQKMMEQMMQHGQAMGSMPAK
jgi:outer membrane murein-binding lipoprotein Lpp